MVIKGIETSVAHFSDTLKEILEKRESEKILNKERFDMDGTRQCDV